MSVESIHGTVVPANIGPGQRESGKGAFGSRVGKDLGIELPVGIGSGVASNWSGCGGGVRSKLKLGVFQALHSSVALEDHDQINAFDADLQSPVMAKNAGALHPFAVRQVATPLPFSAPNTRPPLIMRGTTATHFA